jgi:hypothetical protein
MKKIFNIFVPFKGFKCMTIWPFMFVRMEYKNKVSVVDETHENIHGVQQQEMMTIIALLTFFLAFMGVLSYWWIITAPLWYFAFYGLEYVVRLFMYHFDANMAYRNISFEQEAFLHENVEAYVKSRVAFASFKYLRMTTFTTNSNNKNK